MAGNSLCSGRRAGIYKTSCRWAALQWLAIHLGNSGGILDTSLVIHVIMAIVSVCRNRTEDTPSQEVCTTPGLESCRGPEGIYSAPLPTIVTYCLIG